MAWRVSKYGVATGYKSVVGSTSEAAYEDISEGCIKWDGNNYVDGVYER